jgi:hypothetical protein
MSDPKEKLGPPENDPRNKTDGEYETMPGSFDDSPSNIPGDQPADDTPPPKSRADGTDSDD